MFGLLLGTACGALLLYLLRVLVNRVTAQMPIPVWIIPIKIAALLVFFIPCGLAWPQELPLAGISAAAVLIVGAVVYFVSNKEGSYVD